MNTKPSKRVVYSAVIAAAWALQATAVAEAFPSKPVTIVVPFAAGGFTDQVARAIAPALSQKWQQPVVVDNRPGGGTTIGTAVVANAPADGYSLLLTSLGHVTNPLLMSKLPYDTAALDPLMMVSESPSVLYLANQFPTDSLADFVQYMKANDGAVVFASSGIGSSPHLCAEMLASEIGVRIIHVPYRGNAPAITDLVAGQVDALLDSPSTTSYVKAGRIKVAGVASEYPVRSEIPLKRIADGGVKELEGFTCGSFFGFFIAANTPADLKQQIYSDLHAVVEQPEVAAGATRPGGEIQLKNPEEFGDYLSALSKRWEKVIKERQISLD